MDDNKTGLEQFYPHLRSDTTHTSHAHLLESIARKAEESRLAQQTFITENSSALLAAAQALARCFQRGGKLISLGNGGSACDAAHIAVEFSHPVTAGRRALPAINLTADTALLTALSNDVGFDNVFSRQLLHCASPCDAVLCISTSGNAKNIVNAMRVARQKNLLTIALLGDDGGALAAEGLAEHQLIVPSRSIHRIQECHVLIYHILWDLVHSDVTEVPSDG